MERIVECIVAVAGVPFTREDVLLLITVSYFIGGVMLIEKEIGQSVYGAANFKLQSGPCCIALRVQFPMPHQLGLYY